MHPETRPGQILPSIQLKTAEGEKLGEILRVFRLSYWVFVCLGGFLWCFFGFVFFLAFENTCSTDKMLFMAIYSLPVITISLLALADVSS